jgi:uncharacterized protein (TIGR04255 family)
LLSINVLNPYPKWPVFKALIFEMFSKYAEVAESPALQRIGLRYINQIHLVQGTQLQDVLHYYPAIPSNIDRKLETVVLRTEFEYNEFNGRLLFTLGSGLNSAEDGASFILDLDFVASEVSRFSQEDCEKWVEVAHDQIEIAFEATITEQLRQQFQEV